MQLIGINQFPHIIAIHQKDLSNKAQDFSEYSFFRLLVLQNDCYSFHHARTTYQFLFLQNSWVVHSYSVICKFIMGDILADTAILSNASKKEPLCSCYEHTNRACLQRMGMAAEKRGLCLSGKSVSTQLFLKDSSRLLLSL